MKKLIFLMFINLLAIANSFSQTPTPTAKPVEMGDDDIVKISTTLIQIDVTVTDKDGKVVTNLKPEDFEIYENGKKQSITNFSFISSTSTSTETKSTSASKNNKSEVAIPIAPIQITPGQVRRTIALVVDDLGLSFESINQVKESLRKFVDEQMQPGDLVAIMRTGGGIGALQQFTSDKKLLHSSIASISWNALGRGGISKTPEIDVSDAESSQSNNTSNAPQNSKSITSSSQMAQSASQKSDELRFFRDDHLASGTMGAIGFIVKGMENFPGKKSIMLFSEGFSICDPLDIGRCSRMTAEARRLTAIANRSAITIYAQDSTGLVYTGLTASSNVTVRDVQTVQHALDKRAMELAHRRDGLAFLANETGGQVTFNTNNFNLGLEKMIEEQGSFYLLAYEPNSDTFSPQNNKFNKLEVKLNKRGYNVRYRSGFFGIENSKNQVDSKNNTPAQQLSRAISSPFTNNGVGLKLNTLFGVDEENVSYLNSLLYIEGKDLTFIDKGNSKEAIFDILAVIFDETGNPIDEYSNSYNIDLKGDAYKKLQDDGVFYSFIFPMKKSGAYQMRVALRDANNSRIGSANQFVEIPDLRKNKLILSGIMLENLTKSQWQELQNPSSNKTQRQTNPLQDTSLRRFKRGTILRYASEIYNSKLNPTQKPSVSTKIRIFQDNKLVLDGKTNLMNAENQINLKNLIFTGMLTLGEEMSVGNYVLQIIVSDNLAPNKDNITAQSIQFEIVD